MIRIRMGIDDAFKLPFIFIQHLFHYTASGIFIVPAVYQIYLILIRSVNTYFNRIIDIIGIFPDLA